MEAIILAAGYGTRLTGDAHKADRKTKNIILTKPKPLLPIKGKPIIEHIISQINKLNEVDEIAIITNNVYYNQFEDWLKNYKHKKSIKIINDFTSSNEARLGAIKDMQLVIKKEKIDDDCLVIAGDNLTNINLREFVDFSKQKNSTIIAARDVGNKLSIKGRYGMIKVDKDDKIVYFEEKPENPTSSLASTAIYLFKRKDLNLIGEYLDTTNHHDAPGYFIAWLYKKTNVYAFIFDTNKSLWFDIGRLNQYQKAEEKW